MRAFLIDFENVKSAGLAGIEDLAPDDHVVILYSVNSNTISFEMHQKILMSQSPIEYFQIRRGGKNSLDFQLSSLLGWLLASGKYSHLFIISNDNGFDALTDFWTSGFVTTDAVVRRYHTIGQAISSCRKAEKVRPEVREPAQISEPAEAARAVQPSEPDQSAEPAPEIDPVIRELVREQNEQFYRELGLSEVSAEETPVPAEAVQPFEAVQPAEEIPAEEIPGVPAVEEAAAEEPEINVINVIDLFSMPSSPKRKKFVPVKPRTERPARKAEPVKETPAPEAAAVPEPAPAPETITEPVPEVTAPAEPAAEPVFEVPAPEEEKSAEAATDAVSAAAAESAPAEESAAVKKEKPARKKSPRKEKTAPKKETAKAEPAPKTEAETSNDAEPDAKAARVAEALPAALSELVTAAQRLRIAADLASSKGKQEFYREIIGRYGQKKGLEIYKTVKSEYSNLKKLADSQ
ncbi:MAG: hypothetical protein IKM31_03505 [Oscillospiraceae bacterium]|nr:hypothetical protein [Oscillospiraceae bacterium]